MASNPQDGALVPFHDSPPCGRRSARVGWVVAASGCHIWQGKRSEYGYGRVWLEGRHQQAHRVRYEREVGPVPEGMVLDHFVCDDPRCCNPAHVRPATQRENALRSRSFIADHAAATHCPSGHPYSGGNLYVDPAGHRHCRACQQLRERRRPPRNRPAASCRVAAPTREGTDA